MPGAEKSAAPRKQRASARALLHQGLVGLVLGFPLSIWLAGLLVHHATGGNHDDAKYQIVMWAVVPIWVTVIALVFLARSRLSCWAWLVGANIVAGTLALVLR